MLPRFALVILYLIFAFWSGFGKSAFAGEFFQRIEIPSSPNPVGSGARALGMGGAFIAVADDATAASWNPGGLTQLELPEVSVVGAYYHRTEGNTFGTNPEASGDQSVSEERLNYVSMSYPFTVFGLNMVASLSYQNLYDFTKEWQFALGQTSETFSVNQNIDYQQKGGISAFGLAYAIQVFSELSFGFTLNFWEKGIYANKWEQTQKKSGSGTFNGMPFLYESYSTDEQTFSGLNANLGVLWKITGKLTLGGVFKTPFTADLKRDYTFNSFLDFTDTPDLDSRVSTVFADYGELAMPMSYGVGLAYRFSDQFTLAADIYRTEWGDFIYKTSKGNKICPITGLPQGESDVDATNQIRLGGEYLFIKKGYVIPLRGGVFYDPAPAQGSPDSFFGFSLGSGIAYGRCIFDLAYQYRFGNDVGDSKLENFSFSQDVREHTVYASFILYF